MSPPSPFAREVLRVVAGLPEATVATYGEVATEAGRPGAARAVGRVLREAGEPVPWWRVVRADGRLATGVAAEQERRLAAEGVACVDARVVALAGPQLARPLRSAASSSREAHRVSRRGILHHLELYVTDLEASVRFWGWLLAELGWRPFQEWDEGCSWHHGDLYLALVEAPAGEGGIDRRAAGLNHVAFEVDDRAEIDELTEGLRERGVRILYAERHPYAGGPDHYAVFCEDPDGLKVEVVASD